MEKVFYLLNVGAFIVCVGLSLIAPFYPSFAEDLGVSKSVIGIIFASYPIGNAIGSLIIGKYMRQNNRILILHIGNLIQGISLFGFATLPYLHEEYFIPFSLIFRTIQGFGSSMYLTPFYALLNSFWPDTIEEKMSIAEFSTSLGWFVGPVFGSLLYSFGGFPVPFAVSGATTILIALVLIKILDHDMEPQKPQDEPVDRGQSLQINHADNDPLVINDTLITSVVHDEEDDPKPIGYFSLIKHYEISAGFLTYFTLSCVFTFYNPTYAVFIENKYDKTPKTIGYYQSLGALTYSLTSIFLVARVKKFKQYYIFVGSMICGASQFFYGPEKLFGLDDHLWITLVAQMSVGVASAYPFTLSLPFINEDLGQLYPDQKETAINLSSGLFNWSIAFGELVSPIASGFLADVYGFERASSIFGLWILLSTLLYLPVFFIVKTHTKIEPKIDLVL